MGLRGIGTGQAILHYARLRSVLTRVLLVPRQHTYPMRQSQRPTITGRALMQRQHTKLELNHVESYAAPAGTCPAGSRYTPHNMQPCSQYLGRLSRTGSLLTRSGSALLNQARTAALQTSGEWVAPGQEGRPPIEFRKGTA